MNIFTMVSIVLEKFKKVEDLELKVPKDWGILKDASLFNINNIRIHNPKSSSNHILLSELLKQISVFDSLGVKNLNYFYSNQSKIPEIYKDKTTLFLGTIYIDEQNRLWTPKLYYLPFHEEWRNGLFCLSVDRISTKCNIVLISDNTLNN